MAVLRLTWQTFSTLDEEMYPVLFSKLRSLLGIGASSLGVLGFGTSRVGWFEKNQGWKVLCCEDCVWSLDHMVDIENLSDYIGKPRNL